MNYKESLDYLKVLAKRGFVLGLDNMYQALELLGHPDQDYKIIHIGGTNGKGSTSTIIAQVLTESGYRTGLFTSPQVGDYSSRITVDGRTISHEAVAQTMTKLRRVCETASIPITEFEMTTLLALQAFADAGCDFVVLEVGMGGRLDATNAISVPEAFAISRIGLDHTQWLGDRLEVIAQEKAGIIKRGSIGVIYPGPEEVRQVFIQACAEKEVPLIESTMPELGDWTPDGRIFKYRGKEYLLGMIGHHQVQNAAVAIDLLGILQSKGYSISDDHIRAVLKQVTLEGRCEILSRSPLQIIDASHNPQGLEALFQSLSEIFPNRMWTGIFGVLADKDIDHMLSIMSPYMDSIYCIQSDNPRAMDVKALAKQVQDHGMKVEGSYDTMEAIESDIQNFVQMDGLLVFGSFHHALPIRQLLIEARGR